MDSNATLTVAVIMLGSIKSSDCSPYVSNDNDHLLAALFSGCVKIGEFVGTKINSP